MSLREEIGAALKRRRKELGLTMDQTAKLAKITQQSLWRIEAGEQNFTVDNLEKLCDALNTNLSILVRPRGRPRRAKAVTPDLSAKVEEAEEGLASAIQLLKTFRRLLDETQGSDAKS